VRPVYISTARPSRGDGVVLTSGRIPSMNKTLFVSATVSAVITAALLLLGQLRSLEAASDNMALSVTDYEAGISYRDVQSHDPIGMITNPCSYADNFVPSIDWNDGSGEHKPDTNAQTKLFYTKVPVIQNGVYLFWDDTHITKEPGTQTVTTKLTVHCLGDPPGDRVFATRNIVNTYARIPVNQVEFAKSGKSLDSVKGHETVDLILTLDAPAPASGTWVRLETIPPRNLNSMPPYFRIPARQTQATISDLELPEPSSNTSLVVTASTVGRPQQTQKLTIIP
jgi:hypothetical protein